MAANEKSLADVRIFELLDTEERAALESRLKLVRHPLGTRIWKAGDPGGTFYIVRKGAVELYFEPKPGQRIVFETAREGDAFGEASLLDGGEQSECAVALEDVEALVLSRSELDAFFRERPAAAIDVLTAIGKSWRTSTLNLRKLTSKNVNTAHDDEDKSWLVRATDWIAAFSGGIPFLIVHCVLFAVWIAFNTGPLGDAYGNWDPYPYGLLTMAVSLEAIILSVFVLLSQNREAARDRLRNEIDYAVNLKAELEISDLHGKVDANHAELLARINELEHQLRSVAE